MKIIHKIGKFYTRVVMKNIGIFIFIGLLSVLFGEYGWIPNENIYAISQLVYQVVLPTMIAYEGGQQIGKTGGGVLAALAITGVLASDAGVGILGAMLIGPVAGYLWRQMERLFEQRTDFRMEMVAKNLSAGIMGGVLAILLYFLLTPVLEFVTGMLHRGADFLIVHHMTPILSLVIEPAKVFFLNNLINHAIIDPLGISEVQEAGKSVLFLLESNPGPGMGVLLGLYYLRKERRSEYASALVAEALGGIHEVYFPFVLSEFRLMIPLILGGMAGNFCFLLLDSGLQGVVSPGSVLIILIMAGKNGFFSILTGIGVSALTSFAAVLLLNQLKKAKRSPGREKSFVKRMIDQEKIENEVVIQKEVQKKEMIQKRSSCPIERIVFVCDGGVGSSVMGAALLRRILAQRGITGVIVEAFAADLVPKDVEVIVCQKDFYRMLPEDFKDKEIFQVDSLIQSQEFETVIEQIQERNG